jgi:predicted ATP-binding protein involved in virulence
MSSIPIYIQRLQVENIKTFGCPAELRLTTTDGVLPRWTLILGDNGIGKSTLLQLIAWMKPLLPYDGSSSNEDTEPLITDEENDTLERLVHKGAKEETTATVQADFVAGWPLNERRPRSVSHCATNITIVTDAEQHLKDVDVSIKAARSGVFYKEDVAIYAYSASRQLGKQNINNKALLDSIPAFIREKTELYDAEEILHTLDYASLSGPESERKKSGAFLEKLKELLATLLPDVASTQDITVAPPRILNFNPEGGILFTTRHGRRIPFSDFSLGYRTIASWSIDLAWRLFNKHHANSADPLREPGIVLIDEVDLHLHPVWQRELMDNLSAHFPNIQFIATAHSPLMAQAAVGSNFAVLRFDEEQTCVIINNEPTNIEGWRVDQILTSELFDLKSARGAKYDRLLAQRELMLRKKHLSSEEKQQLSNVTEQLAAMPTGETPSEIEDRQAIADMAKRIRDGQVVIRL